MKRIAIVGGGISGLAAAYELEKLRKAGAELDWHLFEAGDRLGGIVETTTHATAAGNFVLEGGPDAWLSEKPWARELAIELGLEPELIPSNDATRKTYIVRSAAAGEPPSLQAIPDRMRLMVPDGPAALTALDASPLFSPAAREAFHAELARAPELRASALTAADHPGSPQSDESVAGFVRRHFGEEVLKTLAAPLLSGVFGGDVERLSVRAVMAPFVALERDHGSLIAGLGARAAARPPGEQRPPIFTSLRRGMGSLTSALLATLPPERLHTGTPAISIKREGKLWCLRTAPPLPSGKPGRAKRHVHHVLLATPLEASRTLLPADAAALLPATASSATLATFCWPAETARQFSLPPGFGFLVAADAAVTHDREHPAAPQLLAATFVDQKFPHRAPPGARVVRAFFGSGSSEHFANAPDSAVAEAALVQLRAILTPGSGPLPDPDPSLTTVRRWPGSLPQYEVGHPERMAQLDALLAAHAGLHLLGNSYRGVGLPDLIHAARDAARSVAETRST